MSDELPPTLDYRQPDKRKPRPPDQWQDDPDNVGNFFVGLFLSLGVSALIWIPGGAYFFKHGDDALSVIICLGVLKLLTAFAFIFFVRRFRGLGIGILVSLPLSGLIIFGVCAANFRM